MCVCRGKTSLECEREYLETAQEVDSYGAIEYTVQVCVRVRVELSIMEYNDMVDTLEYCGCVCLVVGLTNIIRVCMGVPAVDYLSW